MFVGFGPYVRAIQLVGNIVGLVIVVAFGAFFSRGNSVPTVIDAIFLVVVALGAVQSARADRKGALFGETHVEVRGHLFERVVALENVTAVVIPNPPGVLKVIAADGGFASTQVSANLVEMPADRNARRVALTRLAAALGPRGVYVGEVPVQWAKGLNKESPMVLKRTMRFSRSDAVWLTCAVLLWVLGTLL